GGNFPGAGRVARRGGGTTDADNGGILGENGRTEIRVGDHGSELLRFLSHSQLLRFRIEYARPHKSRARLSVPGRSGTDRDRDAVAISEPENLSSVRGGRVCRSHFHHEPAQPGLG